MNHHGPSTSQTPARFCEIFPDLFVPKHHHVRAGGIIYGGEHAIHGTQKATLRVVPVVSQDDREPDHVVCDPANHVNGEQGQQDFGGLGRMFIPPTPCGGGRSFDLPVVLPEKIYDETVEDNDQENENQVKANGGVGAKLHGEALRRSQASRSSQEGNCLVSLTAGLLILQIRDLQEDTGHPTTNEGDVDVARLMPVDERRPSVVGPSDLDEVEDTQVLY